LKSPAMLAEAGATVKRLLVAVAQPRRWQSVAWFGASASMRNWVNETCRCRLPFPMSRLVVPCNGPVALPNSNPHSGWPPHPRSSCYRMVQAPYYGCVLNTEPAVELPGCVVKARMVAAAGLTVILVESRARQAAGAEQSVIVPATLCDKLAKTNSIHRRHARCSLQQSAAGAARRRHHRAVVRNAIGGIAQVAKLVLHRTTGCCAKIHRCGCRDGCV